MRKRTVFKILAALFFLTIPVLAEESSPTDDIVVKATNAVIFQMTANLKLTQDQISAIQPIIASNIAKTRDLQQELEDGTLDSSSMYSQREKLINDENQDLSAVLSADQMKVWLGMQNQSESHSRHSGSK